jgi:hypothetical protein
MPSQRLDALGLKAEVAAGRSVDARSWAAIRVKRQWLQGEATDEELGAVWSAARAAAAAAPKPWEAAEAAARAATRAAAAAAWAAEAAAWAAARAAAAAASAWAARAAAAAASAWAATLSSQADLLRELLGNPFQEGGSS